VGTGLIVAGRSPDGLVEALERRVPLEEGATWIVGVQWHPEESAGRDPAQQGMFHELVKLARRRGVRARAIA
jgi:putative glutamine amidotransferase